MTAPPSSELNSRSSTLAFPVERSWVSDYCASVNDWSVCTHPQGWIYFYQKTFKVVTDQDIRNPTTETTISLAAKKYDLAFRDEDLEVHINSQNSPLNMVINHTHCVASYTLEDVIHEAILQCDPHTLNRRRRLYWNYLWNHPAHVPIPARAISDASDALTWFFTDNLISGSRSVVPFSKTECEDLIRVLHQLTAPCSDNTIGKTVFLAWLLREVCSFRASEGYGLHTQKASQAVRQSRSHPPSGPRRDSPSASFLVAFIIRVFFFGIPNIYFAHVKSACEYRGRLASMQQNWDSYIERLVREYSDFLLIATVLLSATVGFLAVPGIPQSGTITATLSALSSLSSITVGVFSIWRHKTNPRAMDSFAYMHNAKNNFMGFHGHAMLLSLPPTFLIWAIITFTVAIVAYVVENIGVHNQLDKVSAWVVLAIFVVLLVIVLLSLYTFSIIWEFRQRTSQLWHKAQTVWNRALPI